MKALDRIARGTVVRVGGIRAEVRATNTAAVELARRAPSGVLGTVGYQTQPGQPQPEQYSSQAAIEGAYLTNLYVYRCVDTIAKSLSGCAIRAGIDPTKPTSYSITAKLARLLGPAPGSPNPQWSARQLMRYAVAQYIITGKMAWAKGFDTNGNVASLWPLAVQYLNPIPGPASGTDYFSGYRYGSPGSSMFKTYTNDEVVYLWRPSLKDFRQPESIVEAAQLNISVLRMIDQYDYTFLKNNATPATLVVTEPFAETEQRRAFRDQFVAEFGGYANAGKTLFMERGFDDDSDEGPGNVGDTVSVQRLGITQKEAQQQQTRDAKIRDTCVALGVPLSVLMDSSLAKFQNADQDYRNYWMETCLPLMSELTDGINIALAPVVGPEICWFDTTNVKALQPAKTFKPEDAVSLVTANIIHRDEFRNDLGLPPWSEVDPTNSPVIYPATSMTAAGVVVPLSGSDAAEVVSTTGQVTDTSSKGAAGSGDTGSNVVDMLSAARSRRAARQVQREVRAPESRHSGAQGHLPIPGGHLHPGSTRDDVHKAFEVMLSQSMQALFAEQAKYAQDRLSGRRGRKLAVDAAQSAESLFDAVYWTTRTVGAIEPILAGLDVIEGNGEGRAMFHNLANELGTDITNATLGALRNVLSLAPAIEQLPTLIANVFQTGPERAISMVQAQLASRSAQSSIEQTNRLVDRRSVEQVLLKMHQGQMTVTAAIAEIEAGVAQ